MAENLQMDPFDAAVPGESLTASPEARLPFEQAPAHVDEKEAVADIFMRMTEEENLPHMLDLLRMKVPVEEIAQVVLFEGFRKGQYNPDLMLMLIEPVIYLLMFLADYADIEANLAPEEDVEMSKEEEGMMLQKAMSRAKGSIQEEVGSEEGTEISFEELARPEAVPEDLLSLAQERIGEV